ncbi:MAG TPA: hypothetical protein VLA72_05620, partial [Anaerolineales bacterium]|nr:hypothetical protein [Anaerolineales bacterium]
MPADPITVLGDNSQSGCYLLRMRITQPITVSFGRFNQGRPLALAPGASVYVGSAMQGLAPRL